MTGALRRRRGISFRVKLAAGISALALGIVIALGVTLTELHIGSLERELHDKGERYVQLLARELQPVVAFDDRLTAREVFASMAVDVDIESLAVYTADGRLIEGRGRVPAMLAAEGGGTHTYQARVASPEGPTGTVWVELGGRRLAVDRRHSIMTSLFVAALTASVAFLLAWWFARSVTRRLERIANGASLMANGNLDQPPIEPGALDEIGSVAIAFNSMVGDLRALFRERQLAAASEHERLTELVAARTEQLVDSREQYRLIAESTNAVPFTYVPDEDRFSYIGPQCARILEYAPAAMRAPGFVAKLVDPASLGSVQVALSRSTAGDFELELVAVSGTKRSMHLRMIAARDVGSDGRACVRGLILDMTEHRRLEHELAHAQKLESVGRLAAGIAHEINTPTQFVSDNVRFIRDAVVDGTIAMERLRALRACIGDTAEPGSALADAVAAADEAVEAADVDYLMAEVPKGVDAALEGLGRIATIVRAMREFAHPTQGGFEGADLNQALRSTLTVARNEYRYVADLDLQLGELPPVRCDVNAFNQAVLNIVVNAAHAIGDVADGVEQRGKITVTSGIDGASVVVSITDTGKGIPVHVRDRIFDPFFTTKDVGKGTGQGLAIARAAIVEKHGGNLTFDTEPGRGTTFHIRLPIGAPAAEPAVAAA